MIIQKLCIPSATLPMTSINKNLWEVRTALANHKSLMGRQVLRAGNSCRSGKTELPVLVSNFAALRSRSSAKLKRSGNAKFLMVKSTVPKQKEMLLKEIYGHIG
jgi:hypothetical protein